jgi:hypothetical protein
VAEASAGDSSAVQGAPGQVTRERRTERRVQRRVLEIIPGLLTWVLILSLFILPLRYPEIVAWFVLSFDFYWMYRAIVLSVSVFISFGRIRDVEQVDWRRRAFALADVQQRYEEIGPLMDGIRERVAELRASGHRLAADGGERELHRLEGERRALRRLIRLRARNGNPEPLPDPRELWHVALIPTYTEPYEKLYETVRALAESDYPRDLRMVAIITRESDTQGRENVARLQAEFGDRFLHFFHILDPLEPGVVIGKSSAMAYGGRWLYRKLVELGFDPKKVIVTDLDSDYRVHPQYFGYLTYAFITNEDRYHRLYQPLPMFHNNLWECPVIVRLVAVTTSQLQMWRHLTPERLISFSSYSVSLQTVHEVDYWATDAIPEDSRFYWKSYFRFSGRFQSVPLFMPIYGDAVRARSYPRSLAQQYLQIRRWAWGVTDIPYFIDNAIRHREIPLRDRASRLISLWVDHINWALAPFVLIFGSNVPLFLNETFRPTPLGQQLPVYVSTMLTVALLSLVVLIFIEGELAPPRPRNWGVWRTLASRLQWFILPFGCIAFTNMPALDAQTRLMTGRYLEYKVTEKA